MPSTAKADSDTTDNAVFATCSFCLRPNTDVSTLVAGPGVFICNDCVDLCVQVIRDKPSNLPQLAPWEVADDVDEVLAGLPRIAAASRLVEDSLTGWVRRARTLGATWARIGEALGMTRQSAWERFSGEE